MSTQTKTQHKTDVLPDYCATEGRLLRIVRPPTTKNEYVHFVWENTHGEKEERAMRITLEQSKSLGFTEHDFKYEGGHILGSRYYALPADCLNVEELGAIIMHFQFSHEASDLYFPKRVNGKRKHLNMHNYSLQACVSHSKKFNKKGSFYF